MKRMLWEAVEGLIGGLAIVAMFILLIWWSGTVTEMRMAGIL